MPEPKATSTDMDDRPSGKNNVDDDNTSMDCDQAEVDEEEEWVMDGEEEVGKSRDSKWSEGTQWNHSSNPVHESLPTRECTERSNSEAMDWKSDPKLTDSSLRPVVRVQPLKLLCCRLCNKSFPDGRAVEKHYRQQHPKETGKNRMRCGKCLRAFKIKLKKQHQKGHMDTCWQTPFKLTHAGEVDLKQPQKQTRQKIVCEMCSYVTYYTSNYKRHVAANHVKEKTFACPLCPAKHYTNATSRAHFKKKHAPRPFTCSRCPKAFFKKEELDDHVAAHQGIRKFECEICSKRFATHQNRLQHKLHVHKQSMVQCDVCAVFLKGEGKLRWHKKVMHSGKRFQCPVCPDRHFTAESNLKIHMITHTAAVDSSCFTEKDGVYHCKMCPNRTFKQKGNLRIHITLVHGKEKTPATKPSATVTTTTHAQDSDV
jgi:transcription elongation factor Elf1